MGWAGMLLPNLSSHTLVVRTLLLGPANHPAGLMMWGQEGPPYTTTFVQISIYFYAQLSLQSLKGQSHKEKQGSKVVSIDRSSFKLLPGKI